MLNDDSRIRLSIGGGIAVVILGIVILKVSDWSDVGSLFVSFGCSSFFFGIAAISRNSFVTLISLMIAISSFLVFLILLLILIFQ